MATKFDICSNALVQIGANSISDFSGVSKESEVCGLIYDQTVKMWLSSYWWRFATKIGQLSRDVSAPSALWSASYAQPGDMIALQSVSVGDVNIPFDRYENKILCDASASDAVYATYTYAISETYWPAYFIELIEMALMHKLSFALPAKLDLKQIAKDDLEQQFRLAKSIDNRQQTSRKLPLGGRGSIMEYRRS